MSEFEKVFAPLAHNQDLTYAEAESLMRFLMSGTAEEEQILTILNALCDKGPTETEVVAFVTVMKSVATLLDHSFSDLVDTCGTGGGKATFNMSTAAALVAAGAGVRIAKHGNRSSTGLGSADVLEHLGVRLGGSSEELVHLLEVVGIAFLFAQTHHPAMRFVGPARKRLGRRSVFNLLGPLSNPAGATRQSIGVYDPNFLHLMAGALNQLGVERALVAHSRDGLDEVSPCAETDAVVLTGGELKSVVLKPEDFGVECMEFELIQAGTSLDESAAYLKEAISQIDSPRAQAIVPSAAIAIWLSDDRLDFAGAANRARESISEGRAVEKLAQLVEFGWKG